MIRRKAMGLCALLVMSLAAMAQPPHNVVGYNKDSNTLTTVHYGYGNSVDNITVSGEVQTTISLNGQGMPTELTNDYATMSLSWAGTQSVTVTQMVNGETRTDKLALPDGTVTNYRAEYQQYKQNPSTLDQIDQFLAGGGAKLVGGIIGSVIDMLENPIGACFSQALEAGKATENSIIPINSLQALEIASNLNKSVADRLKDAAVNSIFENYKEWTNEWSDLVYKWQLEKYRKLKADNRENQAWRMELAKTLLDEGKTIDEAVEIINQQHKGGTSDLGGHQTASSSASSNAGTGASGSSSTSGNTSGSNGGNNGGNDGGNDGDSDDDNDDAALFDSQIVIDHIKELYKNDKRGLPPEMIAEWTVYVVWGYHRIVNFKLNPDKKSYTEQVVLDGRERHVDKVDDPHIYVSFNGDDGWGVEKAVIIPLPKK